jgi:hypothetical protein
LATRVKSHSECSSSGEVLPPLGLASTLPVSLQRRHHRITELTPTSNTSATSRRDADREVDEKDELPQPRLGNLSTPKSVQKLQKALHRSEMGLVSRVTLAISVHTTSSSRSCRSVLRHSSDRSRETCWQPIHPLKVASHHSILLVTAIRSIRFPLFSARNDLLRSEVTPGRCNGISTSRPEDIHRRGFAVDVGSVSIRRGQASE